MMARPNLSVSEELAGIDPDLAPLALIGVTRQRAISAMNLGAEKLVGLSRKAAQGRRLSQLIYHDNALFDLIDAAEETGRKVISGDIKLSGPVVDVSLAHIAIETTEEGGFILALTEGTLPESVAGGADSLAAFGKILGHEVKNPLAGISGAAQLLKRSATPQQTELLDLVISESGRIARLVDQLSAFELFSAPARLPCNVHEILNRVLQSEEAAFDNLVQFDRNFDPSLPDIYADSDHIHEACQNIIRNGVEAVRSQGGDGRISVSTRFALDRHKPSTTGKASERSVLIRISDNGPGIPPAEQARIFDMFQTTKTGGSGLGLTIASQIVRAHEGVIELESRPGETLFSLFLPIASQS